MWASSLSLSEAPEDLLLVAHPVNPLLSVHGERHGGDTSFRSGVLADGREGVSRGLVGGGSGELGHSVAGYLLVGSRGPGAWPWAWRPEATLRSGRHTDSGKSPWMAGSSGLLCCFRLRAEDAVAFPFDGSATPLQPGARLNFS